MMKRVMGLDLGSRTCGIAVSDALGIAHGRENYRFLDGAYKQVLAYVSEYLKKEGITVVALGYPLNMDGSKGESAIRSERFKEQLLEVDPNLKIFLVDERLTTVMANRSMLEADISRGKRHKVIDQQSAVIILESFLNSPESRNL